MLTQRGIIQDNIKKKIGPAVERSDWLILVIGPLTALVV